MPVTLNNTNITINDGTNNFVLETVKTHVPEVDIDIDIVPVITYPDTTTRNLQLAAETATGVNGWIHVKHLPASSSTWFYKDDDLQGVNYGTAYDTTSQWSITYPSDKDEILLVKNGSTFEKWLRIDRTIPTTYQGGWYGGHTGTHMTAIDSSLADKRYAYFNDNRTNAPWFWIGPVHYSSGSDVLYQEDSENEVAWAHSPENVSYEVFVRKSTDTISSSIIPAMPVYETQTLPADSTNLVLWYKLDGNYDDSSGNGNTLMPQGNNPNGLTFNTLSDNIFAYSQWAYSTQTGNQAWATSPYIYKDVPITIAFWFRKTGTASNMTIMSYGNFPTGAIQFDINGTTLNIATALPSHWTTTPSYTGINNDVWYHCVYVLTNENPVKTYLYIDGIQRSTGTGSANSTLMTAVRMTIANSGDGSRGFEGDIGDFRFYDKALSAYEIDILANNKIENPDYNILTFEYQGPSYPVIDADAANLVVWYKFDDANDSNPTSTKYNLTNNAVTFVDGKINKCALFDHSSDLLSASTINLSNLLGTEFTFSLWVKVKSGISAYGQVFQYFQDNNNNIYFRRQNANYLGFWIWQNGYLGGGGVLNMPNYIVDVWTHYVITYTGTEAKAYVNGILHQTDAKDGTVFNIGNSTLRIGDRNGLDQHFYGEIDDFRIYNKALSATEISDLYNQYNQTVYTVNFQAESECDILIVGGGGSGGIYGGGGGGGDVIYETGLTLNGDYKINVGKGGAKSAERAPDNSYNDGEPGSYSAIYSVSGGNKTLYRIAGSGGAGDGWDGTVPSVPTIYEITSGYPNNSQGGGGGAGMYEGTNIIGQGIISTYSGNGANSNGTGTRYVAGGGGGGSSGDGSIGIVTSSTLTNGGNGGDGDICDISGTEVYYGGGGGGGGGGSGGNLTNLGGAGGLGGGGTGDNKDNNNNDSIIDGINGLGGGGGGGNVGNSSGGNGGSGIVIIRYKTKYIIQHPAYDAQWTYHSANPNVHHYGNVGIGTLASETNKLTVKGDINIIGDIYENNNKIAYGWDVYGNSVYNQYGNVGIGTNDPRYALHTTGVIYAGQGGITETGSTTWTITSDNRIKENIEKASYDICSENIKNINLYRFNYNTKYVKTTDKNQLGFIAQDVRKYFPKAVKNKTTRFDNDVVPNLLSVDVTQLNYTMYGAVKHIGQDIDAIKEKLGITEVPNDVKNQPYFTEVIPFNDPDAELPIVNEEPATN